MIRLLAISLVLTSLASPALAKQPLTVVSAQKNGPFVGSGHAIEGPASSGVLPLCRMPCVQYRPPLLSAQP
jgi:hypothetical protein